MATAIEFEHVSKQYRLGLVSTKTLSHDIRRFWITNILGKEDPYLKIGETNDRASKGTSEYVWALRDIDFKVEQGDVVGIIGKNGAGKSTLLKLLSRVTGPTTGTIRAHGRIGSLLEVGTGFHGEMTGRENIFMNGAILGMSRAEIQAKLDEIIDFSGCERYIDTPVKRYSSGMTVRLGFAVAAFLEPEILVVDEVLAVGDAEFQKKAIGKMKDVSQGEGRTVLFVSHNMASIKQLCKTGIVLENGMVKYTGGTNDAVNFYLDGYVSDVDDVSFADCEGFKSFRNDDGSSRELEILSVERLSPYKMDTLDDCRFRVKVRKHTNRIERVQMTIPIDDFNLWHRVGLACTPEMDITKCGDVFEMDIVLKGLNLKTGQYSLNFWLDSGDVSTALSHYDAVYNVVTILVETCQHKPVNHWEREWGSCYFQGCYAQIVK